MQPARVENERFAYLSGAPLLIRKLTFYLNFGRILAVIAGKTQFKINII